MIRSSCKVLLPTLLLFGAMLIAPAAASQLGLSGLAASASPGCTNFANTPYDAGWGIVSTGGASCGWAETRTITVQQWQDIPWWPDPFCAQNSGTAYTTYYQLDASSGIATPNKDVYTLTDLNGDQTQSPRASLRAYCN